MLTYTLCLHCPDQVPALCTCTMLPSTLRDLDCHTGRWNSVGFCEARQASMSCKTGQGAKLPVPLFCHPQPYKMEQFTPSSAGCSLQCSEASKGEGGAPSEASCLCPQGTKCWALLTCGCAPSDRHRFVHMGMNLRHISGGRTRSKRTSKYLYISGPQPFWHLGPMLP